jgi:hypothetical protein
VGTLKGRNILIIENEGILASIIANKFRQCGSVPLIALRVSCALTILEEEKIDFVYVDMRSANMDPECEKLPAALEGIPHAFVVGGYKEFTVEGYNIKAPRIDKLYVESEIVAVATGLLSR